MEVRIKKLREDAVIPHKAYEGDAGFDLTAVDIQYDECGSLVCHTGLAFEIPDGYVGLVFPRSSICKKDLLQRNCVGVIDSGYRGEVTIKFASHFRQLNPILSWFYHFVLKRDFSANVVNVWTSSAYSVGDRVAQMIIIPIPNIKLIESDWLSVSDRGAGGYGSSGN